jgi:hypothetical protein
VAITVLGGVRLTNKNNSRADEDVEMYIATIGVSCWYTQLYNPTEDDRIYVQKSVGFMFCVLNIGWGLGGGAIGFPYFFLAGSLPLSGSITLKEGYEWYMTPADTWGDAKYFNINDRTLTLTLAETDADRFLRVNYIEGGAYDFKNHDYIGSYYGKWWFSNNRETRIRSAITVSAHISLKNN